MDSKFKITNWTLDYGNKWQKHVQIIEQNHNPKETLVGLLQNTRKTES